MRDLDGLEVYAHFDPTHLGSRIGDLAGQCQAAWRKVTALSMERPGWPIDQVVIGGMGGSAIAGDLAADLCADWADHQGIPITVVRDFQWPFALDHASLAILCSYSGNTEETLSCFHHALGTNARVIVITGGGQLASQAQEHGVPVLSVDMLSEPRHAAGYNLLLILGVLRQFGLADIGDADVLAATKATGECAAGWSPDVPTPNNLAKTIAQGLLDRAILVYGGGIFSGVARRWKTQLNENAKVWAFFETIPELLHNSVQAYMPGSASGPNLTALVLRPAAATPQAGLRYTLISELLTQAGIPHRVVPGLAGPPMSQLLPMVLLGDYVSYYLALLNGVDPAPVPIIEGAKDRLSQLRGEFRP